MVSTGADRSHFTFSTTTTLALSADTRAESRTPTVVTAGTGTSMVLGCR